MNYAELLASNTALNGEMLRTREELKTEIAYLRRMKFGSSSEQLDHEQLLLDGTAVVSAGQEPTSNVTDLDEHRRKKRRSDDKRAASRELPDHLPRRTVMHQPHAGCNCAECGGGMREIGQDVSEVLDYEPGSFHVVRHVRSDESAKSEPLLHGAAWLLDHDPPALHLAVGPLPELFWTRRRRRPAWRQGR